MTKGQWTVTGLLLLLLGLEVVRSQNVKGVFTSFWTQFKTAVGSV